MFAKSIFTLGTRGVYADVLCIPKEHLLDSLLMTFSVKPLLKVHKMETYIYTTEMVSEVIL